MSNIKRIIPILLIKDDELVKTINFKKINYIGDPVNTIKIFNDLMCPELFIIDISKKNINYELLKNMSSNAFMPLSYGGNINNLDDAERILNLGFEKVCINSLFFEHDYDNIGMFCDYFGNQSIIVSIDVKKNIFNSYEVINHKNKKSKNLKNTINKINIHKPSEILITNIDKEGTWKGFDHKLFDFIKSITQMNVIFNGGIGSHYELENVLIEKSLKVIASSSIFLYQKKDMGILINYPYELFDAI